MVQDQDRGNAASAPVSMFSGVELRSDLPPVRVRGLRAQTRRVVPLDPNCKEASEVRGRPSAKEGADQVRGERKKLQRELVIHLREKDRATLRELRARIHSARVKRRHLLTAARESCRTARLGLKERQQLERLAFRDEQRGARASTRATCSSGKQRAKESGTALEREALRELRDAATLQRQVRDADRRNVHVRSSKRERSQEDDDAVRRNLPIELVPVFETVRKRIKGTPRKSRTEAFLQWAEENPGEIVALQQADADQYLSELLKQQREHGRTMRKAGRYTGTPEELSEALAAVPF